MEKIKALHSWICNKVSYAPNTSAGKNHLDISIFINDSTVCEGYAFGYDLLLQKAGIESYVVNKKGIHVWNIVKLGNHYFHVDTTWDYYDDGYGYNWFLKSDDELIAAGDAHSNWELYEPAALHNYVMDELPSCYYQMGDLNMDGAKDVNDTILLNDYLLGKVKINSGDLILADLTLDGAVDSLDLILMRNLAQ